MKSVQVLADKMEWELLDKFETINGRRARGYELDVIYKRAHEWALAGSKKLENKEI